MSGDLVSLRMLLVAVAPPEADLWRQAAAMAQIPIEFDSVGVAAAISSLADRGADICVVDAQLSDADRSAVVNAARTATPSPLVVMSAPPGFGRIEGADGCLRKPADLSEAQARAQVCIRAKLPTRVLVVDDSRTMRGIVGKILAASRFSMQVQEADGGAEAMDRLRDRKFDLVLLDYNMPGRNGLQILSQIRRENPKVAVVMMTSTIDKDIAERTQAAGAHAFLKKPFYPADVDAMLQRYLGFDVTRI